MYDHTFRLAREKDILGDVDHFVVVGGLICGLEAIGSEEDC